MSTAKTSSNHNHPWRWIPSLYFAEGLPYFGVVMLSAIMYKKLGLSNTEIAFYTAWFYLPWVIKPLWSPFVDILKTQRFWVISMQLLMGAGFAGIALTLPAENYIRYSLAFFWLLAFSSATHDIAADGFYITVLRDDQQAFFVGIRSTFYRIAMITGQGLIVIMAGKLENLFGIISAWQITMLVMGSILILVALYHLGVLPKTETPRMTALNLKQTGTEFIDVFASFFRKKHILIFLAFLLLYRLGEAQLVKIASLFMLDERSAGGLGLNTEDIGIIYGTIGVIALVIGGILGGILVSRKGLKFWIWWMILAINLPDAVYIYLASAQPETLWIIKTMVAIEQFGYGFGFTAYMMYMIYIANGEHKTAHFAITTGFMAMGMMIPGMASGWLQEQMGYVNFFIWVIIATLPAFLLIRYLPLDKDFGRDKQR
jgi:PAT family beta-lactamase induction signal transducer AmpG